MALLKCTHLKFCVYVTGSYTCPFVFSLPKDSPPTIELPQGTRTYSLKAHVHRPGLLAHSSACSVPFTVVYLGDQRPFSMTHNMMVEHEGSWQDRLLYSWRLRKKGSDTHPGYVIGESIPFEITFVPLEKVFIHKVNVKLTRESRLSLAVFHIPTTAKTKNFLT